MHCADSSDCLHGNYGFGNHRHVDGNAVAGFDAECNQGVSRLLDLTGQFCVGDLFGVTGFTLKEDCGAVTITRLDVAV